MKIVGYCIVGSNEADRYLDKTLSQLSELCDEVIIALNAKDEKTRLAVLKYPKVKAYDLSEYEWGKEQWKIKELFFKKCVIPTKPDWVVCLDADEVFEKRVNREVLEELAKRGEIAFTFYCVQLWDREDQMRVDGGWGNFRNVRYFKYIPEAQIMWQRTPLHCGLAPIYAYRWASDSEYLFKHYGYLKKEDRLQKVERYKKYDPEGRYRTKQWYDSILGEPELRKFDEDEFGKKLRYKPKRPLMSKVVKKKIMAKTYYVKNKYGKVYPVSEGLLEETLRRPGMELVEEKDYLKQEKRIPLVEPNPLQCPICGFVAKTKSGLNLHKKKHKK